MVTGQPGSVADDTTCFDDELVADVTFHLLGRVEVRLRGHDVTPTAPKCIHLLALLLTRPRRVVTIDTICFELWGTRLPRRARSAVQTYIYLLRQTLADARLCDDPTQVIVSRPPGYVLDVDPRRIDVTEFVRLATRGRNLLELDEHAEAARALRAANDLWAGPPMVDVEPGSALAACRVDLDEQRRTARHLRVEADIRRGASHEVIGDLRAQVATDRLDESVHHQLMRVLMDCGRRSDAMAAYHTLRTDLDVELGVHPNAAVEALYREMISPCHRVA